MIRTSESAKRLSAEDSVRCHKLPAHLERALRSLKSQLKVRPIHHRIGDRVRAHILICLLAYYRQWHLERAWAPLLLEEEDLPAARRRRDPVAPAEPSAKTQRKKATRRADDELPGHSFATLIQELGSRCRHTCWPASDPSQGFQQLTDKTALPAAAFKLLDL